MVTCFDATRHGMQRRLPFAAFWTLVVFAGDAGATPEAPSYDARANGLAGGGVTYSKGAAAITLNPALMLDTERGDVVLNVFALDSRARTPVLGPNTALSSTVVAPVGYLGVSYRVLPRLVLGLAVQPSGGVGVSYALPGNSELSLIAFVLELDIAAAFAITENLWIGAAYRPSYAHETLKQPAGGPDPTALSTLSVGKFSALGASAGVFYRPEPATRLGLFYRSRLSFDLSGHVETPAGTFDAASHYALPDKFALGVDHTLLDDRLLVAAQVELAMYGWLPDSTTTTIQTPSGPQSQTAVFRDKNLWDVKAGVEYWAAKSRLALRVGLYFGPEEGRQEHASYFSPYIGFQFTPSVGAGVRFGRWSVDAAVNYMIRHGDDIAVTDNGNAGRYTVQNTFFSLGAQYHY